MAARTPTVQEIEDRAMQLMAELAVKYLDAQPGLNELQAFSSAVAAIRQVVDIAHQIEKARAARP